MLDLQNIEIQTTLTKINCAKLAMAYVISSAIL